MLPVDPWRRVCLSEFCNICPEVEGDVSVKLKSTPRCSANSSSSSFMRARMCAPLCCSASSVGDSATAKADETMRGHCALSDVPATLFLPVRDHIHAHGGHHALEVNLGDPTTGSAGRNLKRRRTSTLSFHLRRNCLDHDRKLIQQPAEFGGTHARRGYR